MSFYKFELIEEWYNTIVPDLEYDEVLVSILIARRKYYPKIPKSSRVLDHCILSSNKKRNLRRLRRFLNFEEGDLTYVNPDNDQEENVPIESVACYLNLYPKSVYRALSSLFELVNKWTYNAIADNEFKVNEFPHLLRNVESKFFSCLAKSTRRKPVRILDVDSVDYDTVEQVISRIEDDLGRDVDWISRTANGFHIIVKTPSKEDEKEVSKCFYNLSQTRNDVEFQAHQALTPIPGTLQGGKLVVGGKNIRKLEKIFLKFRDISLKSKRS